MRERVKARHVLAPKNLVVAEASLWFASNSKLLTTLPGGVSIAVVVGGRRKVVSFGLFLKLLDESGARRLYPVTFEGIGSLRTVCLVELAWQFLLFLHCQINESKPAGVEDPDEPARARVSSSGHGVVWHLASLVPVGHGANELIYTHHYAMLDALSFTEAVLQEDYLLDCVKLSLTGLRESLGAKA